MSWLESQIETRTKLDAQATERAYTELAASVTNRRNAPRFVHDDLEQTDGAVRACLRYCGVKPGDVPEGLVYPVITKAISPLAGAWKGDFHICENEIELRKNMATINAEKCMIQPYIEKKTEIQYEGFSYNHGKGMFTGIQIANNYPIRGYYGPYMNIFPPKHPDYIKKLNAMLEEIGFEGLWEIEFLVDKQGKYWFLEINFRSSPWHRAATIAGMPLAYYWIQTTLTGECPKPVFFEPFDAMVETVDYSKRVEEGRCTLAEWVSDFKNAKCTYYYDAIDQEPWKLVVKNWDRLK